MVITYRVVYRIICVNIKGGFLLTTLQLDSAFPPPTPSKTISHKHGRYPLVDGNTFHYGGFEYPINTTDKSGVRSDIFTPIVDELKAIQTIYSRVFFTRFDLRIPKGTPVEISNNWMRLLFKTLHERLKSKNRRPKGITSPINNFAYGWVREKETAKQVHYHCWIALPHRIIQRLGGPTYGVGSAIIDIWCDLTRGEHTLVDLLGKDGRFPSNYVIERGKPETLEGPIKWVSYLAKERGKSQTGKGHRVHSTSKLRNKK